MNFELPLAEHDAERALRERADMIARTRGAFPHMPAVEFELLIEKKLSTRSRSRVDAGTRVGSLVSSIYVPARPP
ncbi:MAG: hypothetical protein ABIT20_04500 [Gemmatimonadaceae bacterium]